MKNKLMDNIDLFIFDMDGILFDTETVYLEYGKKLLKELNYKVTDELVEKTTGNLSGGIWERFSLWWNNFKSL